MDLASSRPSLLGDIVVGVGDTGDFVVRPSAGREGRSSGSKFRAQCRSRIALEIQIQRRLVEDASVQEPKLTWLDF
jgi:hypothetical protein